MRCVAGECPIRKECLRQGLEEEYGIWGWDHGGRERTVRRLPPDEQMGVLEAGLSERLEQRRRAVAKAKQELRVTK